MGILKKFLFGLALVVMTFIAVGYMLPGTVEFERSTVINATPDKVFPLMNDLKKFQDWSPWADLDPNMKLVFSGPEKGLGQKVSWISKKDNVGVGNQTIVTSTANQQVVTALDFGQMGSASASFTLTPVDAGTKVTWGFKTEFGNNPLKRWFGLMIDGQVGSDFDKGLAKLKTLMETAK